VEFSKAPPSDPPKVLKMFWRFTVEAIRGRIERVVLQILKQACRDIDFVPLLVVKVTSPYLGEFRACC